MASILLGQKLSISLEKKRRQTVVSSGAALRATSMKKFVIQFLSIFGTTVANFVHITVAKTTVKYALDLNSQWKRMNYYYAPSVSQPDEHTFLCGYNKVRRYGTTQPPVDTAPKKYITYYVQPNDTLQGIALKNDCTISSIVRANKLWSMDALHLKTSIRIPVTASYRTGNSAALERTCLNANAPTTAERKDGYSQETVMDILSRIDATIKSTSSSVRKLERDSTLDEIDVSRRERSCQQRSRRQTSLPKVLQSDFCSELI